MYFVHSYYAVPADPGASRATADYPAPFAAAVWRDNVFATQFHPEKSQRVGLTMLQELCRAVMTTCQFRRRCPPCIPAGRLRECDGLLPSAAPALN